MARELSDTVQRKVAIARHENRDRHTMANAVYQTGGLRRNAGPAPCLPFAGFHPTGETHMSKVLVLYYSTRPNLEMAQAVAEGARSTGATVDVKRARDGTAGHRQERPFQTRPGRPSATVAGAGARRRHHRRRPTRFGRMPSQMGSFLDQAGGWGRGAPPGRARPSPLPPPSTAARKSRCFPSSPT